MGKKREKMRTLLRTIQKISILSHCMQPFIYKIYHCLFCTPLPPPLFLAYKNGWSLIYILMPVILIFIKWNSSALQQGQEHISISHDRWPITRNILDPAITIFSPSLRKWTGPSPYYKISFIFLFFYGFRTNCEAAKGGGRRKWDRRCKVIQIRRPSPPMNTMCDLDSRSVL